MHSDIASKQAVGFVGAFVPNAWIRAYTSKKKGLDTVDMIMTKYIIGI
jgi:hypothetical protein